jgi:hypothetical protein
MNDYKKYSRFPNLKIFFELGGNHTEQGEQYVRDNPGLYDEAMEWDVFFQKRIVMGNNEGIHKVE